MPTSCWPEPRSTVTTPWPSPTPTCAGRWSLHRLAGSLGIRPITGGELTLTDGTRLVLLAMTRRGYGNLSRLFTLANAVDRREPRLDPEHLAHHAEGIDPSYGGPGRARVEAAA